MDHREFERQIKEYIRQDGRSQAAVARKLGYARDTFNKWVRFVNRMPDTVIFELCELLELGETQRTELLDLAGYATPSAALPTAKPAMKPAMKPPLQRPPRATHFVGREAALARLLDELQPGQAVTLCGPGGVGKTALAAQAVWSLAPDGEPPVRFPDGILFHSFYNQPESDLALEAFVRSYGEEPHPTPEAAARRILAGKRALLILDGAEDADDLARILAVRDSCAVLITSRQRKDAVDQWQMLSPLPPAEASALLQAWGGAWAADEAAVERLCMLVGGLPLALRLAGRFMAQQGWRVQDYLAWLEKTPLAALDQGRRRRESVPLLLQRSLAQVSQDAAEALAVIGRLALAPVSADLIATSLERDAFAVKRGLGELVDLGLLLTDGEHYEVSHALVYTFARSALTIDTVSLERLVRVLMTETTGSRLARERLSIMRRHTAALMDLLLTQQAWPLANELAASVIPSLHFQGYWTDLLVLAKGGLKASLELWDDAAAINHLYWLAVVYCDQGDYETAVNTCRRGHADAQAAGLTVKEVHILSQIGFIYSQMSRHDEAIEYQHRAWQIARSSGDRDDEAMTLNQLGVAYLYLGRFRDALVHLEKALELCQPLNNAENQCTVLHNMGDVYRGMGAHESAIDVYRECLDLRAKVGYSSFEGITLSSLGRSLQEIGRHTEALDCHTTALQAVRNVGDRRNEGVALINLGCTYNALERYAESISVLEEGQAIAQEIGDLHNRSIGLVHLAVALQGLARDKEAHHALAEALSIANQTDSPGVQCLAEEKTAKLLRANQNFDGALQRVERGLSIAGTHALDAQSAALLVELSAIYQALGRIDAATEALDRALDILIPISDYASNRVRAQCSALRL